MTHRPRNDGPRTTGTAHDGDRRAISNAEIDALVDEYRRTINAVVPSSELLVSGSTLLGHYGGHDIDLVVLVPDVAEAAGRLRSL